MYGKAAKRRAKVHAWISRNNCATAIEMREARRLPTERDPGHYKTPRGPSPLREWKPVTLPYVSLLAD